MDAEASQVGASNSLVWWLHDPFIVGAIIVPISWLLATLYFRNKFGGGQTSGADLLAFLVAFDFAAIVDPEYAAKLAKNKVVADHLHPMLGAFVVGVIIAWFIAVSYIEPKLANNSRGLSGWFAQQPTPYLLGAVSWAICWIIAFLHVLGFRGTI